MADLADCFCCFVLLISYFYCFKLPAGTNKELWSWNHYHVRACWCWCVCVCWSDTGVISSKLWMLLASDLMTIHPSIPTDRHPRAPEPGTKCTKSKTGYYSPTDKCKSDRSRRLEGKERLWWLPLARLLVQHQAPTSTTRPGHWCHWWAVQGACCRRMGGGLSAAGRGCVDLWGCAKLAVSEWGRMKENKNRIKNRAKKKTQQCCFLTIKGGGDYYCIIFYH